MKQVTWRIRPADAGRPLVAILRGRLRLSPDEIHRLLQERKILLDGRPCRDPQTRLRAGQRVDLQVSKQTAGRNQSHSAPPKPQRAKPRLRHVDADVVVVEKPAGLTTVRHAGEAAEFGQRGQRYLPGTLADMLPSLIAGRVPGSPGRLYPVHRIDRETSGLVVFARHPGAERELSRQFREHTVERRYLALVRGRAHAARIESNLVEDRGDGRRGSVPGPGKRAVTHVHPLEMFGECSLVQCRLETGRTHQVRIHLAEAGTPLCGERVYDRPLHGTPHPDHSGATRPLLHAATLGFEHPASHKQVHWDCPLPADFREVLERLRKPDVDRR